MTRLKKTIGIILSIILLTAGFPAQALAEGAPVTEGEPSAVVDQELTPSSTDTTDPVLVGISRDKASASAADTVTYQVTMKEENPAAVYLTLTNDNGTFSQVISSKTFVREGANAVFSLRWIIPETIEASTVRISYYGLHDTASNATLVNVAPTHRLAQDTKVLVANDTGNTDILAPELVSIRPTKAEVSAGDSVHFTVRLKDANPGRVQLTIRNETGTYSKTLSSTSFAHNGEEAIYNLTWNVPDTIATGHVHVDFYGLDDTAGNRIQEIVEPSDNVAINSRISVTNRTGNTDVSAPLLDDIKVSQSRAFPGQRVEYEVKVREANPSTLYIGLRQAGGTYHRNFAIDNYTRDGQHAIYRFSWDIPADIGAGNVYVDFYIVYDTAGNSSLISLSQSHPLAQASRVGIAQEPVTERIQGETRYHTAVNISRAMLKQSRTVVLASGENYPDALTGIAYAEELGAPMLLTKKTGLSAVTKDEILRLGARDAVILGGSGAVDSTVESELKAMGLSVRRIQGTTRYETAANIGAAMTKTRHVFLTNGGQFADAISIAPVSAIRNSPILLSRTDGLPAVTKNAIVQWGIQEVTILGGNLAVSQAVEAELVKLGVKVDRISGKTRFDTNDQINRKFFTAPAKVLVSSGRRFPDALTGSLLAISQNATMVLTEEKVLTAEGAAYIGGCSAAKAVVLGGTLAISEAVEREVERILLAK